MAGSQDKITYEDLQTYHKATKPVEWQASTTYYKDQLISHSGNIYLAKNGFTSGTAFSSEDLTAISFSNAITEWKASTTYSVSQCVYNAKSLMVCLVEHTSGTSFDTNESNYWKIFETGSGSVIKTVLWSGQNVTSGTTMSLSDKWNNYSIIGVEFCGYTGSAWDDTTKSTAVINTGDFTSNKYATSSIIMSTTTFYTGSVSFLITDFTTATFNKSIVAGDYTNLRVERIWGIS